MIYIDASVWQISREKSSLWIQSEPLSSYVSSSKIQIQCSKRPLLKWKQLYNHIFTFLFCSKIKETRTEHTCKKEKKLDIVGNSFIQSYFHDKSVEVGGCPPQTGVQSQKYEHKIPNTKIWIQIPSTKYKHKNINTKGGGRSGWVASIDGGMGSPKHPARLNQPLHCIVHCISQCSAVQCTVLQCSVTWSRVRSLSRSGGPSKTLAAASSTK